MASQSTFQPDKHLRLPASPYCSDPDCKYCKELRRAQEQLKQGKAIVASGSD